MEWQIEAVQAEQRYRYTGGESNADRRNSEHLRELRLSKPSLMDRFLGRNTRRALALESVPVQRTSGSTGGRAVRARSIAAARSDDVTGADRVGHAGPTRRHAA